MKFTDFERIIMPKGFDVGEKNKQAISKMAENSSVVLAGLDSTDFIIESAAVKKAEYISKKIIREAHAMQQLTGKVKLTKEFQKDLDSLRREVNVDLLENLKTIFSENSPAYFSKSVAPNKANKFDAFAKCFGIFHLHFTKQINPNDEDKQLDKLLDGKIIWFLKTLNKRVLLCIDSHDPFHDPTGETAQRILKLAIRNKDAWYNVVFRKNAIPKEIQDKSQNLVEYLESLKKDGYAQNYSSPAGLILVGDRYIGTDTYIQFEKIIKRRLKENGLEIKDY